MAIVGPIERLRLAAAGPRARRGVGTRLGVLLLLIGSCALCGCGGLDGSGEGGDTRLRAIDGDTFIVTGDGAPVTVRVALIDAGESSATRYGQPTCGGAQAERFARAWAARLRTVELRRIPGLPREDRYRRRLARITGPAGADYGLAAVRHGWARVTVYEPPSGTGADYLARLRIAQARARGAGRGAWGRCDWRNRPGVE